MAYPEVYLAVRDMDARIADAHRSAESWRLARLTQQGKPGWLAWNGRWLLCGLGFRLVTLGAWLVGDNLPQAHRGTAKS